MSTSESPLIRLRSSRRNLIRMGAVVASAIIAKTTPVLADRFSREDNDRDDRRDRDDRGRDHRDRTGRGEHCFLRGTLIRTVRGDKKVEDLRVGDLVPTMFGGSVPIISIPQQRFGMAIKVARSALGPDVPNKDLYVSSPHALLIDGTLVGAGNLLNGTTIIEALDFDHCDSFNIVLERHNVIYANGTPCETLLGPGEEPCVPRVPYGWRRGLIKSHFRSAVAPWIDYREPVDIIRDGLHARGDALLRQPELVP